MDDLVKSFKSIMYDRVTSPLLSSFLVSWAAWNHRLFVVLLSSDLKLKEKFDYADNILYPTWHEVLLRGFGWPLLSALFLIFAYPLPARKVYEYVRKEQQKLKIIQQKIEDETPITQEEARDLRAAIRKATADFEKQLADRDGQIQKLKADLSAAENRAVVSTQVPTALTNDGHAAEDRGDEPPLNDDELQILQTIAASRTEYNVNPYLAEADDLSRVERKFNLDELLRRRLVTERWETGSHLFDTTAEGRAYIVKHNRSIGPVEAAENQFLDRENHSTLSFRPS